MRSCDFDLAERGDLTGRTVKACGVHYIKYFDNKVNATIKRFGMIRPNARVLLAISGGKDSTSLLYSVWSLRERLRLSTMTAVLVDEGISHREEGLRCAENSCRSLGVPYIRASFDDLFGFTIDQVASSRKTSENTCSYCGVLRRRVFELVALSEGCDTLFTGHNFDDLCQTYLMNVMRNEPARLHRSGPATGEVEGFVPRCSPLARITSHEILEYVKARSLKVHSVPCPHKVGAFRLDILNLIQDVSKQLPGFEQRLVKTVEREIASKPKPQMTLRKCITCGFPSREEQCRPCAMRQQISKMLAEGN